MKLMNVTQVNYFSASFLSLPPIFAMLPFANKRLVPHTNMLV